MCMLLKKFFQISVHVLTVGYWIEQYQNTLDNDKKFDSFHIVRFKQLRKEIVCLCFTLTGTCYEWMSAGVGLRRHSYTYLLIFLLTQLARGV